MELQIVTEGGQKEWKHFQFYVFCQISSQIWDRLFLDFGEMKNIFVLICTTENFVSKAINLQKTS